MKGVFVSAAGADIWVQQYFFLKFKRDGDGKKLGMPRAHWVGPCWSLRSRSLASVFSGLGRSWLQWRRPDEPLDSIWSISAKSIEGSGVCLGETRENKDIREKPPHALFSLEDRRYTLAFMQINKKFLEGLLNSQLFFPCFCAPWLQTEMDHLLSTLDIYYQPPLKAIIVLQNV